MSDTCTIGIDVGGTKVLGMAFAPDSPTTPLAVREVATALGTERLIDAIGAMIDLLIADVGVVDAGSHPLSGVGIGLPGLVTRGGVLRFGPNLPGMVDVDVVAALGPRLGVPIVVDNDGNCAAWAEVRAGAARGVGDALFIGLGTGISCGIVVDGRLVRGAHGFAGEPGHMTIVPDGARCACGRRGCWEAYASGTGLASLARRAAAEGRLPGVLGRAAGQVAAVRGEHVTAAAVEGDHDAVAVLAEFARWVAIGLASLLNVLDPATIVLGGTMLDLGEPLLAPIRRAFADEALGLDVRRDVELVGARLGRRAGAIGAGLLPLRTPT